MIKRTQDQPRHAAGPGASRGFLPGLLGLLRRLGRLAVSLGLAACEDFNVAEPSHDKLGRIAGVTTLIVPLVLADLAGDAQARTRLDGLLDQRDLVGREHHDAMPDPMRSGKQPTQTPYGC